ncbi:hypothetical protein AB0C60_25340, partial [Streptomyces sp. NPDC048845]
PRDRDPARPAGHVRRAAAGGAARRASLLRSSDDRALAAALIADPSTAGIEVDLAEGALRVQAVDFPRFTELLPRVAREHGIRLLTVSPSDESLESVFSYLVAA